MVINVASAMFLTHGCANSSVAWGLSLALNVKHCRRKSIASWVRREQHPVAESRGACRSCDTRHIPHYQCDTKAAVAPEAVHVPLNALSSHLLSHLLPELPVEPDGVAGDRVEYLAVRRPREGEPPQEALERQHAQGPHVHFLPVRRAPIAGHLGPQRGVPRVAVDVHHQLRCHEGQGAQEGQGALAAREGEPEVGQEHVGALEVRVKV